MNLSQHLADNLQGSQNMLDMTVADFSDADLLTRPVAGANHANWQIGHLISAEYAMAGMIGAKLPPLPDGFADAYNKEASRIDDARHFRSKSELLDVFRKNRAAVIAFVKTLSDEQLAAAGPEKMRRMCATGADLVALFNGHVAMHVGQIQVLRRKLGKPVLF